MAVIHVVQGNYGHGWEDLTAETDRDEARKREREYDDNEPQFPHRVRAREESAS